MGRGGERKRRVGAALRGAELQRNAEDLKFADWAVDNDGSGRLRAGRHMSTPRLASGGDGKQGWACDCVERR